jgi:hypothetical protein
MRGAHVFLAVLAAAGLAAAQEDAPPFLENQEKLELTEPAMRLERPSDSWQFLNLAVLREQAKKANQDTSGYDLLRARLWQGSSRSNIFVHSRPDPVSRAEPLTPEQHGRPFLEELEKRVLREPQRKGEGPAKIGPRDAWMFELHGKVGTSEAVMAIVKAITYRKEDNQIIWVTLECPAEKVGVMKKELLKFLKKARL